MKLRVKKHFGAGMVILLPIVLTLWFILFLVNILTTPFLEITKNLLGHFDVFQTGLGFINGHQLIKYTSQLLILFSLFFFIVFLGFVARWVLFHYLIILGEYILNRIPFVNKLYKTCQDIIKTLFGSKTSSFKKVVLVPFPSDTGYTLAFITGAALKECEENMGGSFVSVYVPTTPNPTSGYLMMFQRSKLIPINISVEEGLKFLISCGVIPPVYLPSSLEDKV